MNGAHLPVSSVGFAAATFVPPQRTKKTAQPNSTGSSLAIHSRPVSALPCMFFVLPPRPDAQPNSHLPNARYNVGWRPPGPVAMHFVSVGSSRRAGSTRSKSGSHVSQVRVPSDALASEPQPEPQQHAMLIKQVQALVLQKTYRTPERASGPVRRYAGTEV